ncbi:hypothetical protein F5B18DRAFT_50490 [Nemania serpens]|nr:hypothetical protein F5B18DRAFT_50490 [Nemania serpens]
MEHQPCLSATSPTEIRTGSNYTVVRQRGDGILLVISLKACVFGSELVATSGTYCVLLYSTVLGLTIKLGCPVSVGMFVRAEPRSCHRVV